MSSREPLCVDQWVIEGAFRRPPGHVGAFRFSDVITRAATRV